MDNNVEFDVNGRVALQELANRYESYKKVNVNSWNSMGKPEFKAFKEHMNKVKNIEYKHTKVGMAYCGIKLVNATPTQQTQFGTDTIKPDQQALDLINTMRNKNRNLEGVNEVC